MSDKSIFDRTSMLIGDTGIQKLQQSHVLIAGIGGVGSFTAEAVARAGVGELTLIDSDTIDITNINRQIHATMDTIGQLKTEVMSHRIQSINPNIKVNIINAFILPDNIQEILSNFSCDYIVDCVDTVSAKLALILYAKEHNISCISSMGTANKLDASKFEIVDISKTHTCPLARVMRQELRKRGIDKGVEVLYSTAEPVYKPQSVDGKKAIPGSISYVPSVAGLLLAGHVIQKILAK